jgi:mannose-6-phosphate isomerase
MFRLTPAPLRFTPLYQPRVWGGRRLETLLGRVLPDGQPYGEAWELVDRPDAQSVVIDGPLAGCTLHDLWREHRLAVFGDRFSRHPAERFPLLIKVLDCADRLSIQVHPPALIAPRLGGEPKSEMWHFVAVEPEATLYAGLKRGVTRERFEAGLRDGSVADGVHAIQPAAGDSLMVPSGRLHALGQGLLVFEIQQNSDTTYRVFDWNRPGLDGRPRQLHVAESLECIDFTDFEPVVHPATAGNPLAACEHFRVERFAAASSGVATGLRLVMAIDRLTWAGVEIPPGSVAVWPASQGPAPAIDGGAGLEIVPEPEMVARADWPAV